MVFPAILRDKGDGEPVRIWAPGCASGEEPYSLAITVLEVMEAQGRTVPVKIFATDINEPDLRAGAAGQLRVRTSPPRSPPICCGATSPPPKAAIRSAKAVRDLCVFARHDLTADPPFPRLDLVSCRNLLIYLGPALQRRVIPSLHYGLRAGGYLVLGRSESLAGSAALFDTVDKKLKVFSKLPSSVAGGPLASWPGTAERRRASPPPRGDCRSRLRATPACARRPTRPCWPSFAPAGVTVDAQYDIVEFRGDTATVPCEPTGQADP